MKRTLIPLLLALGAAAACEGLIGTGESVPNGSIRIRFTDDVTRMTRASGASLPDTNDFILKISDASGRSIYSGKYGAAPETIVTDPGTYTIDVVSRDFREPLFDAPQYGDTKVVSVSAGQTVSVLLECAQINSGIQLKISPDFLTSYPNGVLFLNSSDGRLMYSYSEKRIAYFNPGPVSLQMSDGGETETLFTRNLLARQILQVSVSAGKNGATKGGVQIAVDTCRNWSSENYVIGGSGQGGGDTGNAYSVTQAKNNVGAIDVWVYGYIVGGDLSSSQCSFRSPFKSRTNIVLASRSSCTDKESCISVQLSQGAIRDALNLVDHPENLGKQVYIKGDIVASYYGIEGVQSLVEYKWK